MKEMFDRASDLGVESIVMGMAHRGRLNVLGNVVRKPLRQIFCEFSGGQPADEAGLYTGTGDVKYHLGTSYEWRQTFHSDVVVDLVCYRRFGHNEIDEPSFTQPKMYKVIRNHPSALEIYQKKLLEFGELTREDIDKIHKKVTSILNDEFLASKDYVPKIRDWLSAYWSGFKSPEQISRIWNTGVKPEILKNVGKAITLLPENFNPHKAVKRIYEQRSQMVETGED
ncbi:2-oxoglutarate dehydrogenase, mitochondrial-like [Vigna radiata var. radiata]|uniref:2-oxoglutarate dehydrogenase, mitochondrial-like n=1 Tax=Vigna radiata var. radiata TaxID=3916 RepID=A0A3Q0FCX2_VIGRR|nr:2-oxoglutarate dehydrogenase, mitochondrial-like [Vigna radiata var. radiata]